MLILSSGDTWYGKYGFRPYNNTTNEIDPYLNQKYNNNKKIMNKITISDINIVRYIKLTKKESLIKDVIELINNNLNYLLMDFMEFIDVFKLINFQKNGY